METALGKDRGKDRPGKRAGLLLLFLLLATGLRVLRLGFQPLWWDEGYSVWFATHSLAQMAALTAQDIHPPLYYALLHGWTTLLGTGPAVLRLFSVTVGVLAIPLFYLAAHQMLGRRAALLATFLLVINPLHVYYSQEVRMYGLVALLSAGILAAAHRTMDDGCRAEGGGRWSLVQGPWPLVAYGFLTIAALYTQYYAVFLPIGLTIYAFWRWRHEVRSLLVWLAAQLIIALLYLPWVIYAAPKLVPYVGQKVVADADRPLGLLVYLGRHLSAFLAGHLEGPLMRWWPVALLLLVPLAIGWALVMRQGGRRSEGQEGRGAIPNLRSSASMLATVTITALVLGFIISLRFPFFPDRGERLLLLALPPFILLVAIGVDALWRRWRVVGYVTLGLVVATSVASLAAFYTVPRYPDDDYRALIAHTVEQGLPEDMVFAVYPWQVGYWRSYGDPEGPTAVLSPDPAWTPRVAAVLDGALARGRVWFPAHLSLGAILETQVEAYLAGRAVPFANEWHGPNTRLSAWAEVPEGKSVNAPSQAPVSAPVQAPAVRFALPGSDAGAIELTGVTAARGPVEAANAVTPISLQWRADAPPPVLDVSVRLTDELGQIWAQHDFEPLGRLTAGVTGSTAGDSSLPSVAQNGSATGWQATDRLGLLIPAGTPPGRYTVELLVRPKGGGRPLEATSGESAAPSPSVRLFDLPVVAARQPLGPERLPIATRQQTELGDGLRFLGYSTDGLPAAPGEMRKASLFWQATNQPSADYTAFLQLLDGKGKAIPLWEAPPGAAYPTSRWTPGTLMRTQAAFRVPAALPDGRYRLIAGLFRASDGVRLKTSSGADQVTVGDITVRGRQHNLTQPQPEYPAESTFGNVARLTGYNLASSAKSVTPGGTLDLTLDWQALAPADRAYTVFVHLLDEAGNVKGYGDSEPGGGAYPTTGWVPGEYLADPHTVTIAPDAPPGTYQIAVGLYDPVTGERLKTPDAADQVVLETPVTVK